MEISEVRQRVLQTIDQSRRAAATHREETDRASETFEALLPSAAAVWKQVASVLRAEGLFFTVHTPAASLRFASERAPEDFIEMSLDTSRRPVAVIARIRVSRGRRVIEREAVVLEGDAVSALDEHRALEVLLADLEPFVER